MSTNAVFMHKLAATRVVPNHSMHGPHTNSEIWVRLVLVLAWAQALNLKTLVWVLSWNLSFGYLKLDLGAQLIYKLCCIINGIYMIKEVYASIFIILYSLD